MAQSEIIKDINDQVSAVDPNGDTMVGTLRIQKSTWPQLLLHETTVNRHAVNEIDTDGRYVISVRGEITSGGANGTYLFLDKETQSLNNIIRLGRNVDGVWEEYNLLHSGNLNNYTDSFFKRKVVTNATDFNTILTEGYYHTGYQHNCTNTPSYGNATSMEWGLQVLNTRYRGTMNETDTGWTWQTAYPAYGDRVFHRYKDGANAWSSWRTILDSNNFSEYALPLTGGTLNGSLKLSSYYGIYARHIDGSLDGFSGELYLNYNNNAVIRVGHGGNYYISADGSFYSGVANTSYDLYPLKNDMIYTTSTGWYKIAYYANPSDTPRSKVDFIIQGVGGSVGPTTTRISFLLNWGTLGCNEIIIDGDSTYAGGARIAKDANYTYLEIYVRNTISSNGSCFLRVLRNFNNSLSNNNFSWYTGNLPVSTATSTGLSLMHNATGLSRTGRITANAVYGAVWNDYAEYRKAESIEPGRVVVESADGEMKLSTERLQPGAEIISDTFGFAIGETDEYKTPIAATGRVLAYPNEDRYSYPLGCAVCSGPNGTVSQMTREEIREYPERIIGTVSEIPEYKTWGTGNVEVNGRIWMRVK